MEIKFTRNSNYDPIEGIVERDIIYEVGYIIYIFFISIRIKIFLI